MTLNEQQQNILEFAKFYCNKGFSVIPVKKDKRAYVDWKDYQNRRATIAEIEAWWKVLPDAQIAIVTGEISNISVVDIDVKNFDGDPSTLWSFLPENTMIAKTGSGGRHYFFNHMPGLRNKAGIKPHIDIRAEGGYFIAAPSVSDIGSYEWIKQGERLDFPIHLFPELTEKPKDSVEYAQKVPARLSSDEIQKVVDEYSGFGSGRRNDEMTSLTGYLANRIHPRRWDEQLLPALLVANQKNSPPLDEREVKTICNSIMDKDEKNPTSKWLGYYTVPKEEEVPDTEDDEKIMLLSEVAELERVHSDVWFPMGVKPFDDAIGGGLIPGDLMTIGAFPSHGKTSFAQYLTRNFVLDGQRVLFFSYEVMTHHVWDKFAGMQLDKDACIYHPFKMHGGLGWVEKIIRKSKENFNTNIVMIDHFGFLEPKAKKGVRVEGNDSAVLTGIVRSLKLLAREQEVAIVMPVHLRKRMGNVKKNTFPSASEVQNTAGILQESDVVLLMFREETTNKDATNLYTGNTMIQLTKNRRGKMNPICNFVLNDDIFCIIDQPTKEESKPRYEPKEKEPDPQPELNFSPKEEPEPEIGLISVDYEPADPATFNYQAVSLDEAAAMVEFVMGKKGLV